MIFKEITAFKGGTVSAMVSDEDILLYIGIDKAVYAAKVLNFKTAPEVTEKSLFAYCDEIIPYPSGALAERKGDIIKMRNSY